ncbi:YhgE/Pip domain-containing protein [Anaerovorax odorimutans]|uniref:YhgE/Pip domain-containing protein n=1 Tax=Anaerovorax odorimutans TaxID=109327 RepID=A0ABT1RP87_9FIRM|nr:YhgE/Pip domain-containing protein [Anaerovorax odorimutans]MCQ4636983.1 YhgE/Pip domain-containing protein [Anaerovorax odorimutans]
MIKRELKGLLRNPVMMLVLAVILLIPSIYTIPFLSSMWDPYGRLSELPVAVVNEDQPVMYQEKMLSVGADLVDNLKENDSLDFHFVNAKEAEEGLQDRTYYMTITIPKDFSANASTVMDETPKRMELKYKTNPGTNYIASKLCNTAMETIRTSVSEEVSKTYTAAVFDGLDDIASGMDDAKDGADAMLDGEKELIDGNGKLTEGLGTLSAGGTDLFKGAGQLKTGIAAYTAGVKTVDSGVDELGSGVIRFKQEIGTGTNQLKKGSSELKEGVSAYTSVVTEAKSGAAKLTAQNENLNQGMKTLSAGISKMASGSQKLYDGLNLLKSQMSGGPNPVQKDTKSLKADLNDFGKSLGQLNTRIKDYKAADSPDVEKQISSAKAELSKLKNTELNDEQKDAVAAVENQLDEIKGKVSNASGGNGDSLEEIKALSTELNQDYADIKASALSETKGTESQSKDSTGINQVLADLLNGANALKEGSAELQEKVDQELLPGVQAYTGGVTNVSAGLTALSEKNKALNSGADTLNTGIGTLSQGIGQGAATMQAGIGQLSAGTGKLTANSGSLNSGSKDLESGAKQVKDGADQLGEGSKTLGSGLTALQDGTSQLKDGVADGSEEVKKSKADDDSIDMMTSPVELDGKEEHPVADNGHAMAAYMMSVALWVGALAFCLMYPLTKYRGKLSSGFNWWLSKAVVLYPLAIGMALAMLGLMHKFCGFSPIDWKNTVLLACVAAVAFMSLMYFFNALLGRVGSFIMLVFMIIQLAGSAGTYPIELSGDFVADINPFLPFSYTVAGFRSTISGCEVNLLPCYFMLILIAIVFTALSIWLFLARARKIKAGKQTFHDFIDARGFA